MTARRESPLGDDWIPTHQCNTELRMEILSDLPFFRPLAQEAISRINRQFVERGYEAGDFIYMAGRKAQRLFVVADGYVKLMRHTLRGKDVMLDILAQGEFFGSIASANSDSYPETAQAQTPVCTLSISSSAFRAILEEHPTTALKVMDTMAARLQEAQEMVRQLSAYSVEQRIAHVLLRLGNKAGEDREMGRLIRLPLSRSDLASLAGTTPATTSRVMSAWQEQEVIQSGRKWIAIQDQAFLSSLE